MNIAQPALRMRIRPARPQPIPPAAPALPPALAGPPTLAEVFVDPGAAGAAALLLRAALAAGGRAGPLLWLQDRLSRRAAGRPYPPGLGLDLMALELSRPADILTAAEEGLRCAGLGGVIIEIGGDPAALDFTATKRLAMRAEAGRLPCWLIRHGGAPNLGAARMRWRLSCLPSDPATEDPLAPGAALWRAELFRSRRGAPGEWLARHDPATDRFDLVARPSGGAVPADRAGGGRRAAG